MWLAASFWLTVTCIYFVSNTVFITAPDPANEIETPNPGVQDDYLGIDTLSVNDSSAVLSQAISLASKGELSLRAVDAHYLFDWSVAGLEQAGSFTLPAIDDRLRDWIQAGTLRPVRRYPQVLPTTDPARFVNCFGMGAAFTASPAFAISELLFGRLDRQADVVDRLAFSMGSMMVAVSAMLLLLTFARFVPIGWAVLLAGAYAFGTCVFSTSSQGYWQHSATSIYVAFSLWILSRPQRLPRDGYLLGVAMAMATLSRPTMGVIALAIGVYFLIVDRRAFFRYAFAGLPFAIILLMSNHQLFGAPWRFGQTQLVDHAMEKTGVAAIWQTPTLTGLAGLLGSPSRGLFVFSPFLLAAIPGFWLIWKDIRWRWMRAPALAAILVTLVEAHHFDWWGGWSFGYRHLVDLSPILVTLVLPTANFIAHNVRLRVVWAIALAWSVLSQVVGVTSNDLWRWNGSVSFSLEDKGKGQVATTESFAEFQRWMSLPGHTGKPIVRNVDRPEYRDRLWSWREQPVAFYLTHFRRSMLTRQGQLWKARRPYNSKLAASYHHVAEAYRKANLMSHAASAIEWSLQSDPGYQEGLLTAWQILAANGNIDRFIALARRQTLLAPDDDASRLYLAFALVERGDIESANSVLEDVIRRDWRRFSKRLVSTREMMDQRVKTEKLARPASLVQADLATIDKIIDLQIKGRSSELAKKWDDARAAYDRLITVLPRSASVQAHLARLDWDQGKDDEARSLLRADTSEGGER
ncbi:hypothetical protein K2X85_20000 [bacterium]|nr:hypothetical protein [bacterium]